MVAVGQSILPIIVLVVGIFLLIRLKFFSSRELGGGYLFLSGLVILFLSLAWNWAMQADSYDTWFVQSAYSVIAWAQFVLAVIGLLLITAGLSLYADFWQSRRSEIEAREGRLSVLENLQKDARQPYHLMELVNISLKEILYHSEANAGALFLVNRKRRQLVLTASVGFSKEETAGLEYYPLGRNVVNQAIELAEPIISGRFTLIDQQGKATDTRYGSTMILPLISGMDKLGAIVLTASEPEAFARVDISFLMPVSEWLAEKIKSARLSRELSLAETRLKSETERLTDLGNRLREAINSLTGKEAIKQFCSVLVGLAESESVHLYSINQGKLSIIGGSEPLFDLPENFKAALVETLNKNKTLIVNQEATGDDGLRRIILSSLICPIGSPSEKMALLFRKGNGVIRADNDLLSLIDLFGKMARLLVIKTTSDRMAITRRLGFDRIIDLVRVAPADSKKSPAEIMMGQMIQSLPKGSLAAALNPLGEHQYHLVSHSDETSTESDIKIDLSGRALEKQLSAHQVGFAFGRPNVGGMIEQFPSDLQNSLAKLFDDKGRPAFIAVCPVGRAGEPVSAALFLVWEIQESEVGEYERLLTLASALVSFRLTIDRVQKQTEPEISTSGQGTNDLNNALSVILGRAELALSDKSLPAEIRDHLRIVIDESERAGKMVGHLANRINQVDRNEPVGYLTVDDMLISLLGSHRISGSLHMIGGRPREIDLGLNGNQIALPANCDLSGLFETALDRFTATASDEDIITISTYIRESQFFLDISRHRKNFPAVRPVAGFGQYLRFGDALKRRPMDVFLKQANPPQGEFAIDTESSTPAFISFRFKIEDGSLVPEVSDLAQEFRILAIDDEAVILDLIQAMCQSQGWQVVTARSGEEGLALIRQTSFNLVLTDLAMPGLSGLDVARRIRQEWPEIPIILVTGWEAELNSTPIKEAGITDILFKPFRIEQLIEAIQATASRS